MDTPIVPIRNLYYLLCYAWNQLPQGNIVNISRAPTTELVDFFAFVLCEGIDHLGRRGLEQGYELREEELTGVRGRIDILPSARRFLVAHGRAACRFDELTPNTLPNRILKTTLRRLSNSSGLNDSLRKRVLVLHRDLRGVTETVLNSQAFRQVQLHANNRFYRFLLNVCEFIHVACLPDSETGGYRFRDFLRDERLMAHVFQDFLFNFIRIELPQWSAQRERIVWHGVVASEEDMALLPRMETDISISRGNEHIIIDAKYYQNTLTERFGTKKLHASNLFQMWAYLTNVQQREGTSIGGMLVYPRVDKTLRCQFLIRQYPLTVATVDLAKPWKNIHAELSQLFA
ncbi:5-methylcytosine-specific restriction enzyme subunit McrC [Achromobacter spanius]|uniref:5-methylcytosine restriction system specificity protein McrC n=1 Tax=Achromobacter spanius TaxID=217203 RepID=UPI000D91D1A6|nr:hypothetical protein [Achromobacter spanius]CAB3628767.1 Protein McrC [Achromobacter spanius]SPT37491.1 5-methylcytosine-specific restriction enzyme subunit McrC [Achromobacter denitrificans]VEE54814.1 5-methylcytosine-specific restriction enzyme subunit McrC [Achromobacter spanius]